jgi:hypothetical protein
MGGSPRFFSVFLPTHAIPPSRNHHFYTRQRQCHATPCHTMPRLTTSRTLGFLLSLCTHDDPFHPHHSTPFPSQRNPHKQSLVYISLHFHSDSTTRIGLYVHIFTFSVLFCMRYSFTVYSFFFFTLLTYLGWRIFVIGRT